MNYFVCKLRFSAPVHFGGSSALPLEQAAASFGADTLFSALCHTALLSGGDAAVKRLCTAVGTGALLFSDGFPWREEPGNDALYLPRPILNPVQRAEISPAQRKMVRKVRYIPTAFYEAFLRSLAGGAYLDITKFSQHFGTFFEQSKAAVPEHANAEPYFVGLFSFENNCGLYFIMGCTDEELAQDVSGLLALLGESGIGGKVSSGYGKFQVCDTFDLNGSSNPQTEFLIRSLKANRSAYYIALSSCLPADDELDRAIEGASYQLLRRGGFINDPASCTQPRKKRMQYVFQSGSVFRTRFQGELSVVGETRGHQVYRYNRPLWMGVEL